MYFYTYRITNTIKNKHYYGFRSSTIPPKDDLGFQYFSSSTDKEFMEDQKTNNNNYKYKILLVSTKEKCINLEIRLHQNFMFHLILRSTTKPIKHQKDSPQLDVQHFMIKKNTHL